MNSAAEQPTAAPLNDVRTVLFDPNAGPIEAFDPADAVCKELLHAGHKDPFRWLTNIDPNAVNPEFPIEMRRFLVNRQLRMVLGVCDAVDTTAERYCLVDKGTDEEWTMLIRESVAPCLAKNDLPAKPAAVEQVQQASADTPAA